jgi:hypothetical protein
VIAFRRDETFTETSSTSESLGSQSRASSAENRGDEMRSVTIGSSPSLAELFLRARVLFEVDELAEGCILVLRSSGDALSGWNVREDPLS